jgi:hypothetical protein
MSVGYKSTDGYQRARCGFKCHSGVVAVVYREDLVR